jgi:hypothetical protein
VVQNDDGPALLDRAAGGCRMALQRSACASLTLWVSGELFPGCACCSAARRGRHNTFETVKPLPIHVAWTTGMLGSRQAVVWANSPFR